VNSRSHRVRAVVAALVAVVIAAVGGLHRPSVGAMAPSIVSRTILSLGDCAVIGASVSAGCEATLPGFRTASLTELRGHCNFAGVLGAVTNGVSPVGDGDSLFFMAPEQSAARQLAMAKAASPRVLFAVDFLFWHGYGDGLDGPGRVARIEKGLAALDEFNCPIVVGDLPDMSHTILISRSQLPDKATLAEINRRITAWAAARPRVVLIPLFDIVGKAIKRQPLTIGGRDFNGEEARALLTLSGLHVTPEGLIALAEECLERLQQRGLLSSLATWDTDVDAITSRLVAAKQAADAAKKAAKRKSAEQAPAAQPVR
jgi:hypothetical protein